MKIEKVKVGFLETNCYVISINDECLIIGLCVCNLCWDE